MRTQCSFLTVIAAICLLSFQSCKKSDPGPDPVPIVKPDTLSAGWTKQVIAGESGLADIFFNSSTNGYMCASNNLYRSTDGGINWVKLNLMSADWNNCFVTADGKAFFIKYASNSIFKTADGGNNFVNPLIASTPTDIFFTDNNNGYCIAYDGLYNTIDGGTSWQRITTTGLGYTSTGYSSLSFMNNTTGWVVCANGIFRSAGSLTNWQQSVVNGASPGSHFVAVYAVSTSIVYASNYFGEIFKSTDGGVNFNLIKRLESTGFTDLHFLTDQTGYASAGRIIYKTSDGGANWVRVVSLGESIVSEIHFTDATHGWASASNGVVLNFK